MTTKKTMRTMTSHSSTLTELEADIIRSKRARNRAIYGVVVIALCAIATAYVAVDDTLRILVVAVDFVMLAIVGRVAYGRIVEARFLQQLYDDRVRMIYHD